jgi:hypothetical protein
LACNQRCTVGVIIRLGEVKTFHLSRHVSILFGFVSKDKRLGALKWVLIK